ncbi:MAG TPA: protein kinase [Candidatus Angelobacter sp.]|nr:protein kinase [Candidatus Angelobacter sp.]
MAHAAPVIRGLSDAPTERFVIKARLGSGGMGEVFLASDNVLKRQVAVKVIRQEHCDEPSFRERLLREAERASQLNDEHIARVYDVTEYQGRLCLILEYVEGQTLRAKLGEPLPTEEFFSIGEQCLAAVAGAHRRGVLHCDLKPENLMITQAGLVKVLDFGLARRLALPTDETDTSSEPNSVSVGGTPGYIAPEVLLGQPPDQRADIFSIGVILYEALIGHHPFHEQVDPGMVGHVWSGQARPISGPVLAGLDLVLLRMVALDPSRRYQTCADALADLRAVHAGRTVAIGPQRKQLRLALPITLALAAILALGILITSGRSPKQPPALPSKQLLVVLPFRAISDEAGDRALANGLTDTLSAKLGQIADHYPVETVPAAEVRAQKVQDALQARSTLGATLVLEGSMQQFGQTVRVIYSLVDARSQRQVHSGVITAGADNPFAVQDRVIAEVLDKLNIELGKADKTRMVAHGTTQPEAYDSYLRGRGYLHESDHPENLDNAIAAFQNSLHQDPGFGLADAALGQAYLKKYAINHLPEAVALAKEACTQAVALDAGGPEGEICLGMLFNTTGSYQEASRHLERAAGLDPGGDESYLQLAVAYEGLGRTEDAERVLQKAIALRPQHWAGYKRLGWLYDKKGRNADAVQQFQRVVELAPDSYSGYSNLGGVYIHQGKYAEAITTLERSIALHPTYQALSNLGAAYSYQHRYQEAARTYELAARLMPNSCITFGNLAEAYGQLPGRQEESRADYARALELAEQQLHVNAKDDETLSYAALYAARLNLISKAEQYRKAALALSPDDPQTRKLSALTLAQAHQDVSALAELRRAVKQGLPASEIVNDPMWQRFSADPRYVAIIAKAQPH